MPHTKDKHTERPHKVDHGRIRQGQLTQHRLHDARDIYTLVWATGKGPLRPTIHAERAFALSLALT